MRCASATPSRVKAATPTSCPTSGWEWTQVGTEPDNHYGHKNVIIRHLDDARIPVRPISAGTPPGLPSVQEGMPGPLSLGALAIFGASGGGSEFARYMNETGSIPDCPQGVPVRELPPDCRETAPTPQDLFAKLDDWGHDSLVIPHGTTWGYYTSLGSSWDKQLTPEQHDPDRQVLVEVFSGHGNSEEFRDWREAVFAADGSKRCPEPTEAYLPSCWRAGEIIEARCLAEEESAEECAARAEEARQLFVDAPFNGGAATVPGTQVADWQDAGQCRDCFQPAFNYRPRSSVQYLMALGRPNPDGDPMRFRFGFIAASDNHSARPGTGYKEGRADRVHRDTLRQLRRHAARRRCGYRAPARARRRSRWTRSRCPSSCSRRSDRRPSSLNGGLAAVHANGRDRDAIWDAMQRREVYGTSGPRILLWFELRECAPAAVATPMGSRGDDRQEPPHLPACARAGVLRAAARLPSTGRSTEALGPGATRTPVPQGECYHPGDRRKPDRRGSRSCASRKQKDARPKTSPPLIEDPWRVLPCD